MKTSTALVVRPVEDVESTPDDLLLTSHDPRKGPHLPFAFQSSRNATMCSKPQLRLHLYLDAEQLDQQN